MNHSLVSKHAVADFRAHVARNSIPGSRFYCVGIDGSVHPSTLPDDELISRLNLAGGCAGFIALTGPQDFPIEALCRFLQQAASVLAYQA